MLFNPGLLTAGPVPSETDWLIAPLRLITSARSGAAAATANSTANPAKLDYQPDSNVFDFMLPH